VRRSSSSSSSRSSGRRLWWWWWSKAFTVIIILLPPPPSSFFPRTRDGRIPSLSSYLKKKLKEIANGSFVGTVVVAFWTIGNHNPYGFRPRDVLRTAKTDVRDLVSSVVRMEEVVEEVPGLWQRLETLRRIIPMASLDPATIYIRLDE